MPMRRRVVHVDPAVPVVTPVQQPVIERHTTVDRTGMSSEASVILILAGIAILALVWYLAWYRPQNSQTIIETQSAPSTIERSTTEIRTEPAPANPPVIIQQPPARVVTPPADNDTIIIEPPAPAPTPTDEGTTGG